MSWVECSVLLGTGGLPAKNKWVSMSSALAEISLGVLIHAVLPRAFRAAFPSFDDGQLPQLDNDAVDEEYQVVVKRKVYRVGKYLGPLGKTLSGRGRDSWRTLFWNRWIGCGNAYSIWTNNQNHCSKSPHHPGALSSQ